MIGKPKRLSSLFQSYSTPIYFITAVTAGRKPLLASDTVHAALREYAHANACEGRAMGRYVVMPDHLHFFLRLSAEEKVSEYVRWLKSAVTRCVREGQTHGYVWQPGFFDHVMRSTESYTEKWAYVRENPVRAGLVAMADDWPYQGEIVRIEM
jgi:REP element-mobilizing transposase RayT